MSAQLTDRYLNITRILSSEEARGRKSYGTESIIQQQEFHTNEAREFSNKLEAKRAKGLISPQQYQRAIAAFESAFRADGSIKVQTTSIVLNPESDVLSSAFLLGKRWQANGVLETPRNTAIKEESKNNVSDIFRKSFGS